MPVLTVIQNHDRREIPFDGEKLLHDVLQDAGILLDHPCGGRGTCGKCAVVLEGCVSEPNEAEKKAGSRLSCQAVLLGDATVWLDTNRSLQQIELSGESFVARKPMAGCFGAAVDIGTTTMALKLCRLADGVVVGSAACANPQRDVAADVIGRMEAAMAGSLDALQSMVLQAIEQLLKNACEAANIPEEQVDVLVITGNTTMLYLLTGKDPTCLSRSPFLADCLFGYETNILGRKAFLPPCMDAFVGADITCAVLSSGMTENRGPSLLCDIGTNGEIALWKNGVLYVTSTAAGPAFEGAGISCGCGSVLGAVDKVWLEGDSLCAHTIGDVPAVGLCGSGLIDTVAAFLIREDVSETGAMGEKELQVVGDVKLTRKDIRAVQLAKAAIAAGIQTLLETTDTKETDIAEFFICGGFGTHLNLSSAVTIGLIPETLAKKAKVLGNGALSGAVKMMLDCGCHGQAEKLAASAKQMNLGGNPQFNENYIDQMLFPERE